MRPIPKLRCVTLLLAMLLLAACGRAAATPAATATPLSPTPTPFPTQPPVPTVAVIQSSGQPVWGNVASWCAYQSARGLWHAVPCLGFAGGGQRRQNSVCLRRAGRPDTAATSACRRDA